MRATAIAECRIALERHPSRGPSEHLEPVGAQLTIDDMQGES